MNSLYGLKLSQQWVFTRFVAPVFPLKWALNWIREWLVILIIISPLLHQWVHLAWKVGVMDNRASHECLFRSSSLVSIFQYSESYPAGRKVPARFQVDSPIPCNQYVNSLEMGSYQVVLVVNQEEWQGLVRGRGSFCYIP